MNDNRNHLLEWLTLHLAPGLGAASCRRLVDHFGGPKPVLAAPASSLAKVPGLRREAVAALGAIHTDDIAARVFAVECEAFPEAINLVDSKGIDYFWNKG